MIDARALCILLYDIRFQRTCISDTTRMTRSEKIFLTTKIWHMTKRKLSEREAVRGAEILFTFYMYLLLNVACQKLSLILNDILHLLINDCIYSFHFFTFLLFY